MLKVISLSVNKLDDLLFHFFRSEKLFEEYCGIKKIGTRILTKNNKPKQVVLYRVLDKNKLSYAKIKYEF